MLKRKTKEGERLVLSRGDERIEVLVCRARYGVAELHCDMPAGWDVRHAHLDRAQLDGLPPPEKR